VSWDDNRPTVAARGLSSGCGPVVGFVAVIFPFNNLIDGQVGRFERACRLPRRLPGILKTIVGGGAVRVILHPLLECSEK
jgi:hypothetical protein